VAKIREGGQFASIQACRQGRHGGRGGKRLPHGRDVFVVFAVLRENIGRVMHRHGQILRVVEHFAAHIEQFDAAGPEFLLKGILHEYFFVGALAIAQYPRGFEVAGEVGYDRFWFAGAYQQIGAEIAQVLPQIGHTFEDELRAEFSSFWKSKARLTYKNPLVEHINRYDFFCHSEGSTDGLVVVEAQILSEPNYCAAFHLAVTSFPVDKLFVCGHT